MKITTPVFIALLLVIHILFFVYALQTGNLHTKDSAEYLQQAINIKSSGTWYCGDLTSAIQPELFSQRPPLYGTFLMLIQSIFNNGAFISVFQILIGMLNIYIAILLIKKYADSNYRPLFLITALLFFPTQIIYSAMIMSEIFLQFFIMTGLYSLLLYVEKQQLKNLVLFQLAITAALLTKPVFIAFPVLSVILLNFLPALRLKRTLVLSSHLIPLICILLISLSNYRNTGYFEYSSIARKLSVNYHALYSASFEEGNSIAIQKIDSLQQEANIQTSYSEKAKVLQSGSGKIIGLHFDSYIFLTVKGIVLFFIDHSRYDLQTVQGETVFEQKGMLDEFRQNGITGLINYLKKFNVWFAIYLILSVVFNALLLVGLIRFTFTKEVPFYIRLILAAFIIYVALLTGMTGTTRFRMPVFLLILVANCITLKYYSFPYLQKRVVTDQE